jgi:hypothetical protein
MACWFNTDSNSIREAMMSLVNSASSTDGWILTLAGDAVGDPVRFACASGGGVDNADTSSGFSLNTWTHACGVAASATDRRVFINGGSKVSNLNSRTPSGVNRFSIGRNGDLSANQRYFGGMLAEAGIWNVALTDDEVVSLARGFSPLLIRPQSLVAYWPLLGNTSPEVDLRTNKYNLTVTGATKADHPRILLPRGHR